MKELRAGGGQGNPTSVAMVAPENKPVKDADKINAYLYGRQNGPGLSLWSFNALKRGTPNAIFGISGRVFDFRGKRMRLL